MSLNNGPSDRKPDSHALLFRSEKRFKNFARPFQGDTGTEVGDRNNDRRSAVQLGATDNRAAIWHRRHRLDTIDDQVQDDLLQLHSIALDRQRIRKRLGPEQTKNAIAAIREDRMHEFVRIALVYYDKTYRAGLEQRNPEQVSAVDIDGDNISLAAKQVLQFLNENLVAG